MRKLVVVCLFSVIVSPCMSMQGLADMEHPMEKIAMAEGTGKERMNLAGKYNNLVDEFNGLYQVVEGLMEEKKELDSRIKAAEQDIKRYEAKKRKLEEDNRRWSEKERNLDDLLARGFELTPEEKKKIGLNKATCEDEIKCFVNKFCDELTRDLPWRLDFKIKDGCLGSSGFTCCEEGGRRSLGTSDLTKKICARVYLSATEGEEIKKMEKKIKEKSDKVYRLEEDAPGSVSQQMPSRIVCKNILKIFGGSILGSEMEKYAQVFADEKITGASLMRAMARDESVKTEDGKLCLHDDVTGYLFSYEDISEWLRVVCKNK